MTSAMLPSGVSLPSLNAPDKRPCLLVVDDQPINIQAIYRVFAPDHRVLMATSAAKALTLCKEDPPDLVLLDVVMPGMDGYDVCMRLKADDATRNIPVMFVTSRTDADEETKGLALGAVDFIAKPVNPAVVRARVKTHLTLKAQSDLLRQMVFVDGLTGVANRRYFDQRLDTEWHRAARCGSSLALLMLDVDHFKRFNDGYGHQSGDECLRQVASAIKTALGRPGDLVARYGGEEFACILPDTDFEGALAVGQGIERAVRSLRIAHADSDVSDSVTVSVGVSAALPEPGADPAHLLALADVQLYRAKHSGRGRACGAVLGTLR
ncbi:MAG TPA: diguanylate cyclase [Burkholderiaceae bacterium]|nr:diguanylate cyclase [Burkholderiaceae bacterium]